MSKREIEAKILSNCSLIAKKQIKISNINSTIQNINEVNSSLNSTESNLKNIISESANAFDKDIGTTFSDKCEEMISDSSFVRNFLDEVVVDLNNKIVKLETEIDNLNKENASLRRKL